MEIGIRLRRAHFFQWAFDANLAAQAFPVKQQRCLQIGADFLALAAFGIGVKHEPAARAQMAAVFFQQYHTHRWPPIRRGCGQRHGIGVIGLAGLCFAKPFFKQGEGIGLGIALSVSMMRDSKQLNADRKATSLRETAVTPS